MRGIPNEGADLPQCAGLEPPSAVDRRFAEVPEAADLNELVWRVLRERGHKG